MSKEKETIEELKVVLSWGKDDDPSGKAISQAIKWGEALDSAEGELPKKIEDGKHYCYAGIYCDLGSQNFNQAIDIARPILAKAKLRIEELESACNIKDASIETSLKMYRNLEKQLQSLKKRIDKSTKK